MENKNQLLKKLKTLGYPLFEEEEIADVNSVLADVVKSKELRLWEGFPILLANGAEKGLLDYELVEQELSRNSPVVHSESARSHSILVMDLSPQTWTRQRKPWSG